MPIRVRLTIWYSSVLALIVVAMAGFLVWRLHGDLIRGLDSSLNIRAQQTTVALEDPEDRREILDLEVFRVSARIVPPPGAVTQVVSTKGRLLATSGDGVSEPLIGPDAAGRVHSALRLTTADREHGDYRVHASPLTRSHNVLVVANSLDPVEDTTRRLLVLLGIALPAAIGLCVGFGYALARRALVPIDRMTTDAAAIGADDAGKRLDLPATDDEVGRLGRTLNGMLDRLQNAIEEQKRFTADASHELRTPLAIMQSEIDVALRAPGTTPETRGVLTSMHEEVVRMSRLVESLLTLVRADEGGLDLASEEVDLGAVARGVRDRLDRSARSKNIRIAIHGGAINVWGDRDRLDQLLTNLIDNAVKYSPEGGEVRVALRTDNGVALLEVADDGPGIPAIDIPRVFDRFYRVDMSRARTAGGAGLGLAICRSIAEAHHGRIDVRSAPGEGSVFTAIIPLKP